MRLKLTVLFTLITVFVHASVVPEVKLADRDVYLAKKKIYLNDIAGIYNVPPETEQALKEIYIMRAAVPGRRVIVTKNRVENSVRKKFRTVRITGPDKIYVYTQKDVLSKEELKEKAESYILENMPWKKEDAVVEIRHVKDKVIVPAGTIKLRVDNEKEISFKGNTIIPVEIRVNGKFYRIEPVTAFISVTTECMVSSSEIRRKHKAGNGNVSVKRMDITGVKGKVITGMKQLAGRIAKRAIHAGTVLTEEMFETIPLFERGEEVKVLMVVKGIVIEVTGRAYKEGREGDTVKVALITGKSLEGKVDYLGRVIIRK